MRFFVGLPHPHQAHRFEHAFISRHALARRKSDFRANNWILDSGAFSTVSRHGGYPHPPEDYVPVIDRWRKMATGRLMRAVCEDLMCEPWMLARTGLSIADHQRITIDRYAVARAACGSIMMPVLQGYAPSDYADHVHQYEARGYLSHGEWTGVGSVCKRQGRPDAIAAVLSAILEERPDLRLHGFGVKIQSLSDAAVRDRLYSADSMAWSFAARYEGRDGNDPREAMRYAARIDSMPVQGSLL